MTQVSLRAGHPSEHITSVRVAPGVQMTSSQAGTTDTRRTRVSITGGTQSLSTEAQTDWTGSRTVS